MGRGSGKKGSVVFKNTTTIQNWKGDLRYWDYGNQMKSAPLKQMKAKETYPSS